MKLFIYFSEILGHDVRDSQGKVVGKLADVAMRVEGEVYPRATLYVLVRGLLNKEYACIKPEDVRLTDDAVHLKIEASQVVFERHVPSMEFSICQDILDRQVVDTDNQKVVRVNDVHLLRVENNFYLAHVDVGLRGLVRRLEWTPLVDAMVRIFAAHSPYLAQEEFISWKNTQVLTYGRRRNLLRLNFARNKLSQIPPVELAEIMGDLDIFEKVSLFRSLPNELQRRVFADLATNEKAGLVDQLEDQEAANLLENIPADEATDLLSTLSKEQALKLMRHMQSTASKQLRNLLGFAKDSAGGLMTTEYLTLPETATVKDALDLVKNNVNFNGNIYHIYIVDGKHKLLGLTSLRRFINADPERPLMETCYPKKICVHTDDGMEEIALLLEKYKFTAVPVLNEEGILQGVVTIDDVMEELIALAWSKYKEKLA